MNQIDEIFYNMKEIFKDYIHKPLTAVQLSDRLKEDLGLDDLDVIEITIFIEDEYDIEFDDDVIRNFKTISDIVDVVHSLLMIK